MVRVGCGGLGPGIGPGFRSVGFQGFRIWGWFEGSEFGVQPILKALCSLLGSKKSPFEG